MISEDQARELFRGDPAGRIDAYAVLRAGRRARHRRQATLSGGALVAAGTAAFAVAGTGDSGPAVVRPAETATASATPSPRVTPSPMTTPVRVEKDQIGNAVVIGRYVAGGEPRDVLVYFTYSDLPEGGRTVMTCVVALRPNGKTEPLGGCQGPAVPGRGQHVSLGGGAPGAEEGDPVGPLGRGFTYSIVSTSVARGGVYDETGAFHDGRVLGIGDATLPARVLVVERGGRYYRGIRVWDAEGRLLESQGPWLDGTTSEPSPSESPVPHGPE